jgi:hypothetical protein
MCSGSRGHCSGITHGFYSLILLLYFVVLDTYAVVAFSSSSVVLSFSDASTCGFFISGYTVRPSGSLSPSVVVLFAFSA